MARFTLVTLLLVPVIQILARSPGSDSATLKCGKGRYYDDVTNNCEECYDICNSATLTKTEDQCRALCPESLNNVQNLQLPLAPLGSAKGHLSPATIVGICITMAVCMAIAVFIGGVIWKRRTLRLSPVNRSLGGYQLAGVQEHGMTARPERTGTLNLQTFPTGPYQESTLGRHGKYEITVSDSIITQEHEVQPKILFNSADNMRTN